MLNLRKLLSYSSNTKQENFCFIIVLIFPLSLIFSNFIADFIVTISAIYLLLVLKREKKEFFYYKKITIIFILFWIYISFRSLFTDEILVSFKSSFSYVRFYLFSLLIYFLLIKSDKFLKHLYIILYFLIIFVSVDLIIQFYFGYDIFLYPSHNEHRLTGPFGNEPIPGSFLARLAPIILGLSYYSDFKEFKKYNIYFIFITSISTFLTGERTSFFLLMFIYFFFLILNYKNKKIVFNLVLLVSIILLIIGSNKKMKERMLFYPVCTMNIDFFNKMDCPEYLNENRFVYLSVAHEEHFLSAKKMFLDNIFFGQGVKMYRYKCTEDKYFKNNLSCNTHPHNILIQLLAETGVIGFLFYLYIFIYLLKNIFKNLYLILKKNAEKIKPLLIFELIFFQNFIFILPGGQLFNNFYSMLIYFPLGFYLYLKRNDSK